MRHDDPYPDPAADLPGNQPDVGADHAVHPLPEAGSRQLSVLVPLRFSLLPLHPAAQSGGIGRVSGAGHPGRRPGLAHEHPAVARRFLCALRARMASPCRGGRRGGVAAALSGIVQPRPRAHCAGSDGVDVVPVVRLPHRLSRPATEAGAPCGGAHLPAAFHHPAESGGGCSCWEPKGGWETEAGSISSSSCTWC